MCRALCNLHAHRTACYACMHTMHTTNYTHVLHSSFQVAWTHGMHCAQVAEGHMARIHCTQCTQYISPGRDISTFTRSDLQPRSDTSFFPHRTSGRPLQRKENTSIPRTQPSHTGTARSTRDACTRCEQRDSRRSQGDITGLFNLHKRRSTSSNCGMTL